MLDTLYGSKEIQIPDINFEQEPELVESFVKQSPEISELKSEVVPSTVAPGWADGLNGQDCRPRLHTDVATFLLDTGSMASVVRPDPGDKIDHSIGLKTVDGSPFPCYGTKKGFIQNWKKDISCRSCESIGQVTLAWMGLCQEVSFGHYLGGIRRFVFKGQARKHCKKVGTC